jgi:hypothetical protein
VTITLKNKILFITGIAVIIELLLVLFDIFNGEGNIPFYMFIYFQIFLLCGLAFLVIKSKQPKGDKPYPPSVSIPVLIIIAGIIFRITLIPSIPATSPDVFRYVWEGKVVLNGFNPYQHAPDDPQLSPLKSVIWEKVGFKSMAGIYPPVAQVVFVLGYLISGDAPNVWGIKLVYLLCEIFTLIFLLKLLRLKKVNPGYIVLYAWMPVPVMEYFINAHIDVVGITFLIMFLYYMEKGKLKLSAVFFALSFLSKFYPLMLFPLLIKKAGIKKLIPFTLIFLMVTSLFYIPFITKDFAIKNALSIYLSRWEFNGSIYNLIKILSNGQSARIICGILLLITIGIISIRYQDFIKGSFGVLLSFIIFASTVYPWYLGWVAAVNPLVNFYSAFSLLFTVNFSNFTPLGKVWHEYWCVLVIEYIPFFFLLYIDLKKKNSLLKS